MVVPVAVHEQVVWQQENARGLQHLFPVECWKEVVRTRQNEKGAFHSPCRRFPPERQQTVLHEPPADPCFCSEQVNGAFPRTRFLASPTKAKTTLRQVIAGRPAAQSASRIFCRRVARQPTAGATERQSACVNSYCPEFVVLESEATGKSLELQPKSSIRSYCHRSRETAREERHAENQRLHLVCWA